jgi:hypothetical protein
MDILARIKDLVEHGKIFLTKKARFEMAIDDIAPDQVCEAILNAPFISKTLGSKNPSTGVAEKLYVIKGAADDGVFIYTKGKIDKIEGREVFYVLISSKRSTDRA